MLQILFFIIQALQPIIVPLCFFFAWFLIILVGLSIFTAFRDSVATVQKMHRIPCADCQYFTGDYRLKCTVRPSTASTEAAINCSDYQPKTNPMLY